MSEIIQEDCTHEEVSDLCHLLWIKIYAKNEFLQFLLLDSFRPVQPNISHLVTLLCSESQSHPLLCFPTEALLLPFLLQKLHHFLSIYNYHQIWENNSSSLSSLHSSLPYLDDPYTLKIHDHIFFKLSQNLADHSWNLLPNFEMFLPASWCTAWNWALLILT